MNDSDGDIQGCNNETTQVISQCLVIFGISGKRFLTKTFFHLVSYEDVYLKSLHSTAVRKSVTAAGRSELDKSICFAPRLLLGGKDHTHYSLLFYLGSKQDPRRKK